MEQKSFSPAESLQLITSMINQARNRFSENGHLYLLWGWTVFICSIAQFVLLTIVKTDRHYLVWLVTWLVFIYQAIYLRRKQKGVKMKGYTDNILSAVWIVFVVLMFLFGFLFGRLLGQQYYQYMSPMFLALYGMPTILSGTILQFRPLVIGGVVCWALAVLATFITYEYQLLMLSAAVLAGWIIPGYLLRIKYRKSQ